MTKKQVSQAPATEPGYEVRSPCGRVWFLPVSKLAQDYADFLQQADGLTPEEARAKVEENKSFLPTWFAEQFTWRDLDTYGTLRKQASDEEITRALDHLRNNSDTMPAWDAKPIGFKEK